MADFSAARHRIKRAAEHAERLRREVDAYIDSPAYLRTDRPTERGTWIDRVEMVRPPGIELALSLSDGLHQARAALDNMATAMLPGGPGDQSTFVVDVDPVRWLDRVTRHLPGLSDDDLEVLRRLQPFPGNPYRYMGEQIQVLHRMARIDRHSAPLLHAAFVRPKWATGEVVEWTTDGETWAQAEYEPGKLGEVRYHVEVVIADDIQGAKGRSAPHLIAGIIRQLDSTIEAVARGVCLDQTGGPPTPAE